MKQGLEISVNRLPARTWNWLKMNESRLTWREIEDAADAGVGQIEEPATWKEEDFASIETGMGEEITRLAGETKNRPIRLAVEPGETREPVKLHFKVKDGECSFQTVEVLAGENSRVTVIMDYRSEKTAAGRLTVQTRLKAEKGAVIRLIQIQMLGEHCTLLNDVGGRCGEDAAIQTVQLFWGADKTYSGCQVDLAGKGSALESDIGYLGDGAQRFDMNYSAVHRGAKSKSLINAVGVLREQSFKLFRGTIDFKTGSSGAVGAEQEDVLLLGEDVVNQTIPLILCAEEDVQGSHGATIGRLDDELLFYLSSRGLSAEQAGEMIVRARMDALCRKIGDQEEESLAQEYLEEVTGYDR